MCTAMVAAHCVKTTARALARKDARDAAQGSIWRNKTDFSAQFAPGAMPTRDTHEQDMKTVLFCGGLGTRIRDVSESIPTTIDRSTTSSWHPSTKASGVQWTR